MANKIPNRQAICETLMARAEADGDIVVLCSDSRGSGSMTPFADKFPNQFVEVGIAEQSLVSTAAGLAACGKKAFAVSPACFLTTRSMEQARVDVAYSNKNVTLIGISGGISYGMLGLTHHSTQDIATMASMVGMRVYLPSDRHQTQALVEALLADAQPAYVRVGRNPVKDVYEPGNTPFVLNQANVLRQGSDLAIIACGELVHAALAAAQRLAAQGIQAQMVDMYCLKPLDMDAVRAAMKTGLIVTVEEHVPHGGLGSMVAQVVAQEGNCRVRCLTLPDEPTVAGNSPQVFAYYGLDAEGIEASCLEALGRSSEFSG